MTTPISRAAVLEILRTPAASDTFPDMIRRVEALEGCGVRVKEMEDFVADFASAKIDALRYQRAYGESPEDEPDPVVDAETVWAWQADAKTALAALEPVAQPEPGLIATYPHPGYGKLYPIQTVLRDLASQEGCDGEPYDAMMFAAKTIDDMRADRQALVRSTLERAARVAKHRHEVWAAGDGFWDADGLPAVECDVTACDNIADAILALRTAPQPVSEYERKVAQMKEDFPNGI